MPLRWWWLSSLAAETPASGSAAEVFKKRLSFTDATEDVLRRHRNGQSMHYCDITKTVLEEDLVKTEGKTPEATLYAQIITETTRAESGGDSRDSCANGKGFVGLAEWLGPGVQNEIAEHNAEAEAELLKQLRELDPADFEQLVASSYELSASATSR